MFAIIALGGKQYKVKEKDVIRVEKLDAAEKKNISIDEVLLVSNGKETKIGAPYVSGAAVELKILKHGRNDKVVIFKMKSKKRYKRLRGHRQPFTEVEIAKIKS